MPERWRIRLARLWTAYLLALVLSLFSVCAEAAGVPFLVLLSGL